MRASSPGLRQADRSGGFSAGKAEEVDRLKLQEQAMQAELAAVRLLVSGAPHCYALRLDSPAIPPLFRAISKSLRVTMRIRSLCAVESRLPLNIILLLHSLLKRLRGRNGRFLKQWRLWRLGIMN